MIALLVLLSVLALDTCDACGLAGRRVTLCESHAEEEREVFARERRRLASGDETERLAALEKIAALTHGHENAPSERVASGIAAGLADGSPAVRMRALALLGRPQNAFACLVALEQALKEGARDIQRIEKERADVLEKLGAGDLAAKKRDDLKARLVSCNERWALAAEWRLAVVRQIAKFPDDRAVAAVIAHAPRDLLAADVELARLGSRAAMQAAILGVKCCEEAVAQARAALEDRRALVGADAARQLGFDAEVERLAEEAAGFQRELVTLLAERGLAAPLAPQSSFADWTAWLERNAASFPEKLPGIRSPAW